MKKKPRRLAARIIADLRQLNADLAAGKPIPATRVTREETPDGPLHTHKRVLLRPLR